MRRFWLWFCLCACAAIWGLVSGESHWTVMSHDFFMGVGILAAKLVEERKTNHA